MSFELGLLLVSGGVLLVEVLVCWFCMLLYGGGGVMIKFVCGYLVCDDWFVCLLLSGLLGLLCVNVCGLLGGFWLEILVCYVLVEVCLLWLGGVGVFVKFVEVLFIEVLWLVM